LAAFFGVGFLFLKGYNKKEAIQRFKGNIHKIRQDVVARELRSQTVIYTKIPSFSIVFLKALD